MNTINCYEVSFNSTVNSVNTININIINTTNRLIL